MQIMTEKGLIERDESVRPQIYRARYSQEQTQRQLVRDLHAAAPLEARSRRLVLQALAGRKVHHPRSWQPWRNSWKSSREGKMTSIAQSLSSALLRPLWQGVLVAFVLWIALFLLRKRSGLSPLRSQLLAPHWPDGGAPAITAWKVYDRPVSAPITAKPALSQAPYVATALRTTPSLPLLWLATFQQWALPVWSFGVLLFSIRLVWGCSPNLAPSASRSHAR